MKLCSSLRLFKDLMSGRFSYRQALPGKADHTPSYHFMAQVEDENIEKPWAAVSTQKMSAVKREISRFYRSCVTAYPIEQDRRISRIHFDIRGNIILDILSSCFGRFRRLRF